MKLLKIRKVLLVFFLAIILFTAFLFINHILSIKHIIVESDNTKNSLRSLESLKKQNIVILNTKKTETAIKNGNPLVKQIIIKKIFPDTLRLDVQYQSPIAELQVAGGYFALSSDGTVLKKTHDRTSNKLPQIHYYQSFDYYAFPPGAKLNYKDLISSIFFLQKALDLNLSVDNIDINGLNMIVFSLDSKRILFTTEKGLEQQAYELQSIIHQFKVDGKDFKELDLRFDRPVVRFLAI